MKSHVLLVSFVVLSLVNLPPCLAQSIKQTEINGESLLTFQIKASDIGTQVAFPIVYGKNADDIIEMTLPGELFVPPQDIEIVNQQNMDRSSPEKAAILFFSANKSGDAEWILRNWASKDQGEIKKFLEDKEMFKKNQDVVKTIENMVILGKAKYKEYALLFVRNNYQGGKAGVPLVQTYVPTEEGWKNTNDLSADETVAVVWAALRLWDNKWHTQN